jgi:predicted transposase YdaD
VQRIYLNELEVTPERSLGLKLLKLVVESNRRAPKQARALIAQAQQEVSDRSVQREIMEELLKLLKFSQEFSMNFNASPN